MIALPRPLSPRSRRRLLVALVAQSLLLALLVWLGLGAPGSLAPMRHLHLPGSPGHRHDLSGHEGDGGLLLTNTATETVAAGETCPPAAPLRSYDVVAVRVEITLNRFLDHDPAGRMFVLEQELPRVRQEEARNRSARADGSEPAVSIGLQGDAIAPLVVRVNRGECLEVRLRNDLPDGESATFHLHGSTLYVAESGAPALATEPGAVARPGETVTYRWWVAAEVPEGTHYAHSHGDTRRQTAHGLFGAVIVEPAGSQHLDPASGAELRSGWAAVIRDPAGSDFREFVIVYHEVGNERYRLLDGGGRLVVQVDPLTGAYRPGARAINYRSEPFLNRLALQQRAQGRFDESLAYSSYAFGDPATPIARSYLGDPVKQRIVHGGSEVFHVHHVHGGATRWRRQPLVEATAFDVGRTPRPSLLPLASERIDAQSIGPSESFDLEHECGSGGCQQGVGDFMVHCHVAHHYFAGMWMLWRVYNTLQAPGASQDGLPPLAALPDRAAPAPAVTSAQLLGTAVPWGDGSLTITDANFASWVERQLPPAGEPRGYDASVWDWRREGDLYLGEPDSLEGWPGHISPHPGERPEIRFDPRTGLLAYPLLRPHLGRRPPFAPGHGPAPFLDPSPGGAGPPPGGAAAGPCAEGTTPRSFVIHAISLPVSLNHRLGLVDPVGQLFVLKREEERIRSGAASPVPLVIRANAGEDCIEVVFKSELPDSRANAFFSKANIHIHLVQFDVQGSDGVTTGFNYEQSVRPFTVEGETLIAAAAAGDTELALSGSERFSPGALVGVGMDEQDTFEIRRVEAVEGDRLLLDQPLAFAHREGEIVSSEFVRYRWYPDVQFGTAYFHDHVAALDSWQHGLFGALIAEPPGSSYRHPHTGEPVASGPIADIHTEAPVSADIVGSFRELVLFLQDDNLLTRNGDASGGSLNLRVEPPGLRSLNPLERFLSSPDDPETPILEAFPGDPLLLRGLVAATNDVHTLHLSGHAFRIEPYAAGSPLVGTAHLGISERVDLSVAQAGGVQQRPGDYLLRNGRASKLREGSWGLLRVHDGPDSTTLQPLPGREIAPAPPASLCPDDAPRRSFTVAALDLPLDMLDGATGRVFVLEADSTAVLEGDRAPEPLVLHANLGDCLRFDLRNGTSGGPISLHLERLAYDPRDGGLAAGRTPGRFVAPGETGSYLFYAAPEVGAGPALLFDGADLLTSPRLGLYGAVVLGLPGTRYTDPDTGEDVSLRAGWRVDAHPPSGQSYRDFTLLFQDDDEIIGTAIMPYTESAQGALALNYQREPLSERRGDPPDPAAVYRSDVHGDPRTPLLEAATGDDLRLHLLVPYGEQGHVFAIEGHRWFATPGLPGSDLVDAVQIGPLEVITVQLRAGSPGDYLYGDHREPYREAGLWGLLRIRPAGPGAGPLPLPTAVERQE